MRDAGYDVADYFTIDPRYGSNDDLADQARGRGIRILLDLVAGHTSDARTRRFICDPIASDPAEGVSGLSIRRGFRPAGPD
jgi:1,4-alpha-glucan branching enzyme